MSRPNRIALIGHRGWVAQPVLAAFAAHDIPVKILHRPGADTSMLAPGTVTAQIDMDDPDTVVSALHDIDIFISLIGRSGLTEQIKLVPALSRSHIQVFVPSVLSPVYTDAEYDLGVAVLTAKNNLARALKEATIPFVTVLIGNFAEFALNTPAIGIDVPGNRVVLPAGAHTNSLSLCTRPYVAEAYVSLFAHTAPTELVNRNIGLIELRPTGADIISTLQIKHGRPPVITSIPVERLQTRIREGGPITHVYLCMLKWADGTLTPGDNIWDVKDARKATMEDLLVRGELGPYVPTPLTTDAYFASLNGDIPLTL